MDRKWSCRWLVAVLLGLAVGLAVDCRPSFVRQEAVVIEFLKAAEECDDATISRLSPALGRKTDAERRLFRERLVALGEPRISAIKPLADRWLVTVEFGKAPDARVLLLPVSEKDGVLCIDDSVALDTVVPFFPVNEPAE